MTFLSGCEAIAQGAWEGGASFSCSYPGSPVTGIIDSLKRFPEIKTQWVANEKVGMEIAVGIAHAGARSLVIMKHVGLNVAADPFFNAAYTGVRGSLVVIVGDDPGAKSSQNEQDTRLLALAANVPVLEPSSIEEALVFTRLAFDISHKFDVPVVVRVTTQLCYGTSKVVTGTRKPVVNDFNFARPIQKYLLLPKFVPALHKDLNQRIGNLMQSHWSQWFCHSLLPSDFPANPIVKYPFGIVVAGFPGAFITKVFQHEVPILKIGMSFPLNEMEIRNFAQHCEFILVVEESSRFIEHQLRAMNLQVVERPNFDGVGEFNPEQLLSPEIPQLVNSLKSFIKSSGSSKKYQIPLVQQLNYLVDSAPDHLHTLDLPPRPPGFCAGCSHRGIFYELSKRNLYVVGDIGCYTLGSLEPFNALHTNLCMGASIGLLHGYITTMGMEAARSSVAVIGDSTFFHSGIPPLMTAITANIPATVLILDNSGAAMTGHQTTSMSFAYQDWENFLSALKVPEFAVVDALDIKQLEVTLDKFLASGKLSVMVLKGDCVQGITIKKPTNYRYMIRPDMCIECGECLKVDCPAIVPTWDKKNQLEQVAISNECIGCGLCSQTCPEHAIVPRTVNTLAPSLTPILSQLPWHAIIRRLHKIKPIKRLLAHFERETY